MRYTDDLRNAGQRIIETLEKFFEREAPFDLIQPATQNEKNAEHDGNPWHFLVTGLTREEPNLATKTKDIALQTATLLIVSVVQPILTYVMTLKGITFDTKLQDNGTDPVKPAIIGTLEENKTSSEPISRRASMIPSPLSPNRPVSLTTSPLNWFASKMQKIPSTAGHRL